MSHHFSPEFTVLPAGKEPVSKKLQRNNEQTSSAKHRETQKLDFDNKQMEWKLNQLRQVMSKEKEDRGKQHNIWKSGGAKIESHSRNILGRTVSATNVGKHKISPKSGSKSAPKSKQSSKVKVLRDEPLDLPQRDSLAKDLTRRFKNEPPPNEDPASVRIETPKRLEHWINFALDKESNDIMELQSDLDGNLKLETVQAFDPTAVGIYFVKWGRKRLLIAGGGVIRKPKNGWGDEIYYPYASKSPRNYSMKPEPPLRNVSNTLPIVTSPEQGDKQNGGRFLQGSFDEAKNAESFQQALNEWRRGKNDTSHSNDGKQPEMSVHVAQCTPEPYKVEFSETSTLSYMEHLLLEKHRKSQLPPMPTSLIDAVNGYTGIENENQENEDQMALTEEEQDERRRYRKLFSPEMSNHPREFSSEVLTISEVENEDNLDITDQCIIEESPPSFPVSQALSSNPTVTIEEVSFDIGVDNNNVPIKISQTNGHSGGHDLLDDITVERVSKPSALVHEIGKISINPDAHYHRGLNHFFASDKQVDEDMDVERFQSAQNEVENFTGESMLVQNFKEWNPGTSFVDAESISPEISPSGVENRNLKSSTTETDSGARDDDSADGKALDDLEWELASRNGNITSDGRISRLIDDWSEDGDLEIIDDPGVGSGLSTPDVRSNCVSRATAHDPDDPEMQYDFQNMEHMIMADLSDEYSGDEV